MSVTAIVVAAGVGARLDAGKPKAFVEVGGVPLLIRSLRALLAAPSISDAVVVAPPSHRLACAELIEHHGPWRCRIAQVGGGRERQDSVRAGMAAVGNAPLVAVHDAARPFVELEAVERVIALAAEHGAAILAVPTRDTVKQVHSDGWVESTPPRERMWAAQTPQVFRTDILRRAHEEAVAKGFLASDDALLVERVGVRVYVTAGSDNNRKITTPEDLRWAEWFVSTHQF